MKFLILVGTVLLLGGLLLAYLGFRSDWMVTPSSFSSNFLLAAAPRLADVGLFVLAAISFFMSQRTLERADRRMLIGLLPAIGILLMLTGLVYIYADPYIVKSGPIPPTETFGSTIVISPSGVGNVTLRLQDTGMDNAAITTVTASNKGSGNNTMIPAIGSLVFLYQGNPVSPTNPIPAGGVASGSLKVANLTEGVGYFMTVDSTFSDGSHAIWEIDITAQT
jgi:hypothetical protein